MERIEKEEVTSFLLNRLIKALVITGRTMVASPSIIVIFAFSLILPQLTASRGLAPLKLPSHSSAVEM